MLGISTHRGRTARPRPEHFGDDREEAPASGEAWPCRRAFQPLLAARFCGRKRRALAVDFFTVETVSLQRLYLLFFIGLGARRAHVAGCVANPSGAWVAQQVRQFARTLHAGTVCAGAPRPVSTNRRHRTPRPARRPYPRIQHPRMKPNLRSLHGGVDVCRSWRRRAQYLVRHEVAKSRFCSEGGACGARNG